MKQISSTQLSFLITNFLFTATLISLPQVLTQLAKQNSWLVPILIFPLVFVLFYIGVRKVTSAKHILNSSHRPITFRILNLLVLLLLITLYIRDVRAFIDFMGTYYLPNTPIEVLTILLSLTLVYIAAAGLEVIARITVIQLAVLGTVLLSLPILLLNEIDLMNMLPIITPHFSSDLGKSSLLLFPWMGEAFIFFLLLGNVSDGKKIVRFSLLGLSVGIIFFTILLFLNVAVLGNYIAGLATYPNIFMIQEIRLTDFLDRLDLMIVIFWVPCLLCRLALILYCIHQTFLNLGLVETNLVYLPLGLTLGLLSVVLFKNNIAHLEFSFYSWTLFGIVIELMILFVFVIQKQQKKGRSSPEG